MKYPQAPRSEPENRDGPTSAEGVIGPESRPTSSRSGLLPATIARPGGEIEIEVVDDGGRDLLSPEAAFSDEQRAPPASLDFALLRGALEEISFGVATTRSGQILYANAALERLYGAERGGLEQKHVRLLFDQETFLRVSDQLDEQRIFDGRIHTQGLDGRPVDAEVHAEWYSSEALGIGGFLVFRDVSLELGALSRIVDQLGGVLFRIRTEDGSLEFVSPAVAKLTGIEPLTCTQHPVLLTNLVSADERERVAFLYKRLVSGEISTASAQVSLRRPDGRMRVLQLRATGRKDTGGRVRHLDGVVTEGSREGPETPYALPPEGLSARPPPRRKDNAGVASAVMEIAQEMLREASQHLHGLNRTLGQAQSDLTRPSTAGAVDAGEMSDRLDEMSRALAAAGALNRRVRRAMAGATPSATLADLLDQARATLGRVIGSSALTVDLGDAASVLIEQRVDEMILALIYLGLRAFRLVGSGTLKIEARKAIPLPVDSRVRGRHLGAPSEAQDTLIVIVGGAPPESSLPGVEISAELQTLPRQNEAAPAFTAAKALLATCNGAGAIDDLKLDEVCTVIRLRG